jgi:hypothetical protein
LRGASQCGYAEILEMYTASNCRPSYAHKLLWYYTAPARDVTAGAARARCRARSLDRHRSGRRSGGKVHERKTCANRRRGREAKEQSVAIVVDIRRKNRHRNRSLKQRVVVVSSSIAMHEYTPAPIYTAVQSNGFAAMNSKQNKRAGPFLLSSIFDLTFRRATMPIPPMCPLLRCAPPLAFDHVHTSSASRTASIFRFVIFAHNF